MSRSATSAPAPCLALSAPAKLNLGLRVLGRRPDGYHELESVFVPVDLADRLELALEPGRGVTLELEGEAGGDGAAGDVRESEVPLDASNLAVRAAADFLAAAGREVRVTIRLRKRIPPAAGLGGGSSDAGAVLRGLAQHFPEDLTAPDLERLALALGADVPFFLDPRPALVRGVGEIREPLSGVPALCVLLVNPGAPLSTPAVFEALDALGPAAATPGAPPALRALSGLREHPASAPGFVAALRSLLVNDLEPAAVRLCPPVGRLRRWLEHAGALAVGLSGSGPTLFGVFEDRPAAERLQRALLAAPSGVRAGPGTPWARVAVTVESR